MFDDILQDLRGALARVMNLDLWPPWDAARTIVDAVAAVLTVTSTPPRPEPDDIIDAAAAWRRIARSVEQAHDDLGTLRSETSPEIWRGTSGGSFRSSVGNLRLRVATVTEAATAVRAALLELARAMRAARARHDGADEILRRNLSIDVSDLNPWGLVDKLRRIVGDVVEGIREMIGAYEDARDAIQAAQRAIQTAMDGIELPDRLPTAGGVGAIDIVNAWDDDGGPLAGAALSTYDDAFAALPPAEQETVRAALAGARNAEEAAWIMAGVASGLGGPALERYLEELGRIDPALLDPRNHPIGDFVQPNQQTCGSSSLVMSRMLNDPAYAMRVLTGFDPLTGQTTTGDVAQRFGDEAEAMHDRTNQWTDRDGGWQFDWPQAIGTQPYALANEMSATGGSGVPGTDYDVRWVDPADADATFNAIVAANEAGHAVPMYVGNDVYPGHIVLITATTGDTITYYDPAGVMRTVSREDFVTGSLPTSQENPWAVVLPDS